MSFFVRLRLSAVGRRMQKAARPVLATPNGPKGNTPTGRHHPMSTGSTTATSDTATATTLPPIKCAPWCEDGDGHVNAGHPDDQYCSAGHREIELARKPEQIEKRGPWYRRQTSTSLQQDPFSEPYISVSTEGADEFTIDEARALRDNLTALLEIVDGPA